jgi:hypothetical protein
VGLGLVLVVTWLAGGGRRRWLWAVGIGFVVLVAVRIFLSWQLDSAGGEPQYYAAMAESLVASEPELRGRPPGYAVALAGAYLLIADRQLAAEALNLLMSVLAGGIVLVLARGLYGARVGALALLGYAIWPAGALMTSVSMPHVAFDLAIVAAAWAAVGMPPGRAGDALSGALLGLGQYVRPLAPFLLPTWIITRLWQGASLRSLILTTTVMVAAFLVALIPAMAWNLGRTGSLSISTSDWGGSILFVGLYEPSGGMYTSEVDAILKDMTGPATTAERRELGDQLSMQRIREDPLGVASLAIRKQDTLWGTEHYGIQYALSQGLVKRPHDRAATVPILVSQVFYVIATATAAAGLYLVRRRPDALVPLAITLIWLVSAMHGLLEVRDRHHSYVVPLLLPWSALAVTAAWDALSRRLGGRPEA